MAAEGQGGDGGTGKESQGSMMAEVHRDPEGTDYPLDIQEEVVETLEHEPDAEDDEEEETDEEDDEMMIQR